MGETEHKRFLREYKRCENDEQLKAHLKSRIARGIGPSCPPLTYDHFQRAGQVRLLTLLPGSLDEEIKCKLRTYDLASAPIYVALSYVWGDKTRTLPIQCDRSSAFIPLNLYSALIRIRKSKSELVVWVDALCINQADDPLALQERASQVRMMGRIFPQAEQVIVDLGGATKEESSRILRYCQEQLIYPPDGGASRSVSNGSKDLFWIDLKRFVRRPWFQRVWIVQEFVLARKVKMLMGTCELEPLALYSLLLAAVSPQRTTWSPEDALSMFFGRPMAGLTQEDMTVIQPYFHMMPHRLMYHAGRQLSLVELLSLSKDMAATDLRDHVYALAGLVTDWDSLDVEISYTRSSDAVRASIARALINRGNAFYCLSHATGINISGMTWMPLLRNKHHTPARGSLVNWFMGIYWPLYRASGDLSFDGSIVNDIHLAIRGFRVDTIRTIAPVFPVHYHQLTYRKDPVRNFSYGTNAMKWYVSIRRWARVAFPDLSPSVARDKLWQAIMWDSVKDASNTRRRVSTETLRKTFQFLESMFPQFHSDAMPDRAEYDDHDLETVTSATMVNTWSSCRESRICSTDAGRMINAPQKTVGGNEIWILFGIPLPMVLRDLGDTYAVVGPAFVEGLMVGEALNLPARQDKIIHLS